MKAADTSVVIPALVAAHERHRAAAAALDDDCVLPAHAALEVYSVLTRAPDPMRAAPTVVVEALRAAFDGRVVQLGKGDVLPLIERLALANVRGRDVYDALIAETARRAGATLVTDDRRAANTYEAVGVEVEYL